MSIDALIERKEAEYEQRLQRVRDFMLANGRYPIFRDWDDVENLDRLDRLHLNLGDCVRVQSDEQERVKRTGKCFACGLLELRPDGSCPVIGFPRWNCREQTEIRELLYDFAEATGYGYDRGDGRPKCSDDGLAEAAGATTEDVGTRYPSA